MRCSWEAAVFSLLVLLYLQSTTATDTRDDILDFKCPGSHRRCGHHWYKIGRQCVKVFTKLYTFAEAQAKCARSRGSLLSLHAAKQAMGVLCLVLEELHDEDTPRAWIGGKRGKNGQFAWVDGTKFNYKNWVPGQPDNSAKLESCMEMNWSEIGKWNDHRCSVKKPFVCVKTRK